MYGNPQRTSTGSGSQPKIKSNVQTGQHTLGSAHASTKPIKKKAHNLSQHNSLLINSQGGKNQSQIILNAHQTNVNTHYPRHSLYERADRDRSGDNTTQ